jgi:cytochrome c2
MPSVWLIRHQALLICAAAVVMVAAYLAADEFAQTQKEDAVARVLTSGDASLAPPIFRKFGCSGCHTIPGVPGADGEVGGSLEGLSKRVYIGGVLTNTPDHLVSWIVSPEKFSARTAMPTTGISEAEASDLAAYLYSR